MTVGVFGGHAGHVGYESQQVEAGGRELAGQGQQVEADGVTDPAGGLAGRPATDRSGVP